MEYDVNELRVIFNTARQLASDAAKQELNRTGHVGSCGFAWVELRGIKGNTKLGRTLKKLGITQGWNRVFSVWNPSGCATQSMHVLEKGAIAYANYLKTHGFNAVACSRMD